jgi:hypothetical protein
VYNFWTARVNSIKIYIFGILVSRAIAWYIYGSNRKGGWSWGVQSFLDTLSKTLLGHSYKVLIHHWNPLFKPSQLGPFLGKLGLGGVCGHVQSQRHTRSGAGRGVSQANGAAIHPKFTGLCQHEIVSGILKKWKQCGTVQASYGCLVGQVCTGVYISVFAS